MDLHLEGKVVILTGGFKGIGKGIALRLAKEGAIVAVINRDDGAAEQFAAEMKAITDNYRTYLMDLNDTDAIAPSDAVAFSLLQEQFKQVLETLSPREAGVIKMRYGLEDGQPKTLDDIGRVYGVTRERIRQIESKTMSKLRHPSRSQTLRDFLDQ